MPQMGRIGLRTGTRERVVPRTPYIVVYRIGSDALDILHVFDARQNWTGTRNENGNPAIHD